MSSSKFENSPSGQVPQNRTMARDSREYEESDALLNLDSPMKPEHKVAETRRPFVRSNALRGANFHAAMKMDCEQLREAQAAAHSSRSSSEIHPTTRPSVQSLQEMSLDCWAAAQGCELRNS